MSTPNHPNYGKYFQTHEEMKRMLQPKTESVDLVRDWLENAGISHIDQDADWITFHTTVETANELLDANFQYYFNYVRNVERLRTLEYSVPDSLVSHINMVSPTTRFGHVRTNRATLRSKAKSVGEAFRKAALTADCNGAVTPQCLKGLYAVGDYKADSNSDSKVAFASYLEQYARYSDLALFEQNLAPWAQGQNFSVIQYHGGLNNQTYTGDSSEANLDLQYIIGLSSPISVTEFSTGGRGPLVPDLSDTNSKNNNEPYLEFLQNVVKMDNKDLPQVISTSYGEDEQVRNLVFKFPWYMIDVFPQTVPEKYARSVCNLFAQLGSRGVSVIFSSGDSGVGSACETNDGTNKTHFPPQFPAACPWVTSVGATTGTNPERAVYFSSGGFSDLWERPKYQNESVNAYLKGLGNKWTGLFNPKGRAFPDVATQGENFAVYDKGSLSSLAGTSCSAPTFAGIIALLNDARLRANQPVMGFLNPWLYSNGLPGLNDITHGGSTGCNGNDRFNGPVNGGPNVPYASWNATKGWDPVTGLGTPHFSKMLNIAMGK